MRVWVNTREVHCRFGSFSISGGARNAVRMMHYVTWLWARRAFVAFHHLLRGHNLTMRDQALQTADRLGNVKSLSLLVDEPAGSDYFAMFSSSAKEHHQCLFYLGIGVVHQSVGIIHPVCVWCLSATVVTTARWLQTPDRDQFCWHAVCA